MWHQRKAVRRQALTCCWRELVALCYDGASRALHSRTTAHSCHGGQGAQHKTSSEAQQKVSSF